MPASIVLLALVCPDCGDGPDWCRCHRCPFCGADGYSDGACCGRPNRRS